MNMIEKELANVQKCLQYDTSLVPEHCRLKKPTSVAPTNGSRSQNTSTDTCPVPEREEHCKLKKPRGQNTSTDQTRRILRDAKLDIVQILQSQVCERSPREQKMTEATFLTIGNRSRTKEKSFGKAKNQTVTQPTRSRNISTDPTGSRKPTGSRSVSTDHTGSRKPTVRTREKSFCKSKSQTVAQPTGKRSVSTDPTGSRNPTGSRSVSTYHTGNRSSSTDQNGCGGQNPSTDHMRRLLQNAKLDLVQILKRSTSVP